jgi:Flp pilus assembly pilin Flp
MGGWLALGMAVVLLGSNALDRSVTSACLLEVGMEDTAMSTSNNGERGELVQGCRTVANCLRKAWSDDHGQDIAEYAVMLAVILVIVVGTIRLIGSNSNTVFSQAASSIQ